MDFPQEIKNSIDVGSIEDLQRNLQAAPNLHRRQLSGALVYAMEKGFPEVVGCLLHHGAKLTYWAFAKALNRQDPAFIQELINHGWDINFTEFGTTAVHRAISKKDLLIWLLEHGANPNTRSRRTKGSMLTERNPLTSASISEDTFGLDILLHYGAVMDDLALFATIEARLQKDRVRHVKILLDHGANVNKWTRKWGTPLHYAVQRNRKDIVRYLLERGADLKTRDLLQETPSETAVRYGRTELLEILSKWGDKEIATT
ncbi:ankyrin [Lentithecium fluviatile CBS 122367]|uniref:Ankyrin n=1 Tax=Lentithecium fluviatile CBS 122367 TaxID=1168545 RepID=A0A6G1ID91_9PLEO|nr:ankyrin [Lentithecium fluviatile CBS 122367]